MPGVAAERGFSLTAIAPPTAQVSMPAIFMHSPEEQFAAACRQ